MIYKKIYFCKKLITLLTYFPLFLATTIAYSQDTDLTPFEKNPARTTTYAQCIDFYQLLDRKNRKINMLEAGPSDVAEPLHLVIIDIGRYIQCLFVCKNGLIPSSKIERHVVFDELRRLDESVHG